LCGGLCGGLLLGCLAFAPGCGKGDDKGPAGDPRPSEVEHVEKAAEAPVDHESLYLRAKQTVENAGPSMGEEAFRKVQDDLRKVAEEAEDPHLEANASLLLGSLLEERGDRRGAISYYRQARALVPEEAGAHAMLALALAAEKQFDEAIEIQKKVVELVPDDLQAWLLLGEMQVKGGREKQARETYAAYELRRKGLIDGLTLRAKGEDGKPGPYMVGPEDRAGCAAALEPAADNGTALALMYALSKEPEPMVRAEIARVMGTQRLVAYAKELKIAADNETDGEVKEVMMWAMGEISRDPVETAAGPAPAVPAADDAGETGEAPAGPEAAGETG
jgi:tetratricopeptide (TPR) repeat protein